MAEQFADKSRNGTSGAEALVFVLHFPVVETTGYNDDKARILSSQSSLRATTPSDVAPA
jgi:hypothetical protein